MSELEGVPEPERSNQRGRGVAFLALFVALASAGVSAYLFYRLEFYTTTVPPDNDLSEVRSVVSAADERGRKLDQRVIAIESALAERSIPGASDPAGVALDDRFAAERERIDGSIRRNDESIQRIDETIESLYGALGTALQAAPPTTAEWKLAEAEYLLRIGNHRVLMEHDARGASSMFRAADEVIRELDDVGLLPVRAALAEEIAALDGVSRVDVDGAFVRLEALKKRIDDLPVRLPGYIAEQNTDPAPGAEPASLLQRLAARFSGLIRIREHSEGGLTPLLDPAQAGFFEMNLELALERAGLALLRDDATLYRSSLDSARRLLDEHLDAASEPVVAFRAELDGLAELEPGAPLPDVSRSLRLLRAIPRVTPGHESASQNSAQNPPQSSSQKEAP